MLVVVAELLVERLPRGDLGKVLREVRHAAVRIDEREIRRERATQGIRVAGFEGPAGVGLGFQQLAGGRVRPDRAGGGRDAQQHRQQPASPGDSVPSWHGRAVPRSQNRRGRVYLLPSANEPGFTFW